MSSIIHFTKCFENLTGILNLKGFNLFYCSEDFNLGDTVISSAVHPMVSFSQQNINSIDEQTITYGRYGIGFKRSWVKGKQIHPVMYMDKNSTVARHLSRLLKARRNTTSRRLPPEVRLSIMMIKCFTKKRIGYNSNLKESDFDFYREKEWRYVPEKLDIEGNLISVSTRMYTQKKEHYNSQLKQYPLTFNISDIENVFVKDDSEKKKVSKTYDIDPSIIYLSGWRT